jgi:hypothetical protein
MLAESESESEARAEATSEAEAKKKFVMDCPSSSALFMVVNKFNI